MSLRAGRVIAPIGDFPARYKEECCASLAQSMTIDPTMPFMEPDVVLVNFYSQKSSLVRLQFVRMPPSYEVHPLTTHESPGFCVPRLLRTPECRN